MLAEGQVATSAALPSMPRHIALASNGDMFVEMGNACSVHKVSAATGAFTTVMGEHSRWALLLVAGSDASPLKH